MPAGDFPRLNQFANCWYPYGTYPPYTITIGGTSNVPEPDDRCPKGTHQYVQVESEGLGVLTGRLLLYCERCGDVVEYPPKETHE